MSKTTKTALAIALTLLLTGACLVGLSLLQGVDLRQLAESGQLSYNPFHVDSSYTVCPDGELRFAPGEVRRLALEWVSGSVTVRSGCSELLVQERCDRTLSDDQKLCWKLSDGTLTLRYCRSSRGSLPRKDLTLTLPEGWVAQDVTLSAVSADLDVRELATADGLTLETTSGEIRAEGCRCRALQVSTVSGEVFLRCSAETIAADSTSGSLTAEDVPARCTLRADSVSGDVYLALLAADGQRVTVSTTSGDVTLRVPGAVALDFDSVSGKLRGSPAEGGLDRPQISVDTVSGDLILAPAA